LKKQNKIMRKGAINAGLWIIIMIIIILFVLMAAFKLVEAVLKGG